MSYTKGPWEAQETRVYFPNCWGGFDLRDCPDAVANAHLISAAPELLEALEMALEWIDAVPQETPLPAMPGFDRDWVNDVIAKAKSTRREER